MTARAATAVARPHGCPWRYGQVVQGRGDSASASAVRSAHTSASTRSAATGKAPGRCYTAPARVFPDREPGAGRLLGLPGQQRGDPLRAQQLQLVPLVPGIAGAAGARPPRPTAPLRPGGPRATAEQRLAAGVGRLSPSIAPIPPTGPAAARPSRTSPARSSSSHSCERQDSAEQGLAALLGQRQLPAGTVARASPTCPRNASRTPAGRSIDPVVEVRGPGSPWKRSLRSSTGWPRRMRVQASACQRMPLPPRRRPIARARMLPMPAPLPRRSARPGASASKPGLGRQRGRPQHSDRLRCRRAPAPGGLRAQPGSCPPRRAAGGHGPACSRRAARRSPGPSSSRHLAAARPLRAGAGRTPGAGQGIRRPPAA